MTKSDLFTTRQEWQATSRLKIPSEAKIHSKVSVASADLGVKVVSLVDRVVAAEEASEHKVVVASAIFLKSSKKCSVEPAKDARTETVKCKDRRDQT